MAFVVVKVTLATWWMNILISLEVSSVGGRH